MLTLPKQDNTKITSSPEDSLAITQPLRVSDNTIRHILYTCRIKVQEY